MINASRGPRAPKGTIVGEMMAPRKEPKQKSIFYPLYGVCLGLPASFGYVGTVEGSKFSDS